MPLRGSHTFDASVDGFIDMLANPEAIVAKYESMHQREVTVEECERGDDSLRMKSSRVLDVNLPGFARKVFRPTNTAVQTDEWVRRSDGSWDGTFTVEIRGAPIRIHGTMKATPADGHIVYDITAHVDVHVPLVGGRLADWVTDSEVRRSIEEESTFYERWLKEHA